MRPYIKAFLWSIVFISIFIANLQFAVLADEEIPTVKVAMSEDESIIVERILYTALKRLGYQMVTKTAGMRTTVNDVNFGDAAIVPAQTTGLDKEYHNLLKVPVPISYVETNAYTLSEKPYQFSSWSELAGLRLCHRWQNLYITRNVPRAGASQVVTLNDYKDLWDSLLANNADVAVIPSLTGFVRIVPDGIKLAGVIEREPRYTYVNREYSHLVPLLTQAYQDMTDDGTMELIRNSRQSSDKQIVLHLSSYSPQIEWERREIEAIRKSLELNPKLEYQNLNLNARQITNKANINAIIANTIRTNFIERNPDLIIASDNDALEFVLNNYYMLFPKVPVVFCGVNNFDMSMLHGFEDYVTGVSETESFDKTIKEMLRLYPQTQRVYILNDYTHSGLIWRDSLRKKINADKSPLEFTFSGNEPFADILKEIRGFDSRTLVLVGTYFLDSNNAFYSEKEVQELVGAASPMPVFCLANSFNGYGTLGGLVSVGDTQGKIAGTMAHEILGGMPPAEIPVIVDSEHLNRWQFDYAVAERFSIKTSALPAGHTFLNRKLPIWESNPFEFTLALTAGGFLLVIITGLGVFLRLMRQKNMHLLEIQSHLHSAEELLEKDNDLRKMIESLPVAVLIVDIKTCKPVYGNQAFLTANGFGSFDEASELDLSQLVEQAFSLWQDKAAFFNYGSLRQPDSEICQRISAEKLMYHNKNCLVLICEDITAQLKETEMLARAAQKEKEANTLKSMFLANMSHEIRTPMNAIIGMAGIAKRSGDAEKKEDCLDKIEGASKYLLGIINDILDVSKIEANKFELLSEEFDIGKMLTTIINMINPNLVSKQHTLTVNIDKNVPERVVGDEQRLSQVITNLLSNAVKFTPDNGKITLDVKNINKCDDMHTLQVEIADNGIGIAAERQAHIFNLFEQANGNIHRQFGGTGLGLSIAKRIVEMMDGHMWIESELNKGSKFIFTVKLREESGSFNDTVPQQELPEITDFKKHTLLLVEDVYINREIILAVLEDTGISIDCAENGLEAVKLFKEYPDRYSLILMDINMPEMDGFEATRIIRGEAAGRDIPIVAMTANVFKEDIDRCIAAGMNDHIGKPISPDELLAKMNKYLAEKV